MKVKMLDYHQQRVIAEISLEEFQLFISANSIPWMANEVDSLNYKGLNLGDYAWALNSDNMRKFNKFMITIELNKEVIK